MKVAIIGAGWAGLAAAVDCVARGAGVTLFEAARSAGGRARSLPATLPDGGSLMLDNGQHILIGAYAQTLALMQRVGAEPSALLQRLPLALRFPDGGGMAAWPLPPPFDVLAGIATARGWSLADRLALLRAAWAWRRAGFACAPGTSVAQLGAALTPRVRAEWLEPLCISALNTLPAEASGTVFLRVLRDALLGPGFGGWRGSDLLVPRAALGALLPDPALRWLAARGAALRLGQRVQAVVPVQLYGAGLREGWQVDGAQFDAVVLACPPGEAARLAGGSGRADAAAWAASAPALRFEAITTVYALRAPGDTATLAAPMFALRSGPGSPAQFVFDRGLLGGPRGVLAFVVSASTGARDALEQAVLAQAARELNLGGLRLLRTVVERRATFACTPGLVRPAPHIAPGLLACGDYVDGPYPATLEGAVQSGQAAARSLFNPVACAGPPAFSTSHAVRPRAARARRRG